jgi:hypothetical protein
MSAASAPKHLTRRRVDQTRPQRTAGGLYRSIDNEKTGLGGVSMASAEDAMVAAVRMAYDIADNQITRSKRLADRLKGAADRATGNDPKSQKSSQDAVDAAGRLVNNAMLSGMSWVEALMAAEDGLAPRLATAQFKAVKSVLFGRQGEPEKGAAERVEVPSSSPPPRFEPEPPRVRILLPKTERRAIRLVRWEVEPSTRSDLSFRFVGRAKPRELDVELTGVLEPPGPKDARPTLTMESTPLEARSGLWRAAVCGADGEQLGIIEIEI